MNKECKNWKNSESFQNLESFSISKCDWFRSLQYFALNVFNSTAPLLLITPDTECYDSQLVHFFHNIKIWKNEVIWTKNIQTREWIHEMNLISHENAPIPPNNVNYFIIETMPQTHQHKQQHIECLHWSTQMTMVKLNTSFTSLPLHSVWTLNEYWQLQISADDKVR